MVERNCMMLLVLEGHAKGIVPGLDASTRSVMRIGRGEEHMDVYSIMDGCKTGIPAVPVSAVLFNVG